MTTNTGGSAFPFAIAVGGDAGIVTSDEMGVYGLTIRDYFAARLMPQIMDETRDSLSFSYADAAKYAYLAADAMLKARG